MLENQFLARLIRKYYRDRLFPFHQGKDFLGISKYGLDAIENS